MDKIEARTMDKIDKAEFAIRKKEFEMMLRNDSYMDPITFWDQIRRISTSAVKEEMKETQESEDEDFDEVFIEQVEENNEDVPDEESILETVEETKEDKVEEYINSEIQECYKDIDANGNDHMSIFELQSAFSSFNMDVDFEDCKAVIDEFDSTGMGYITGTDFFNKMHEEMLQGTTESHIKMVFEMIDSNHDGIIVASDIIKQFQRLGAPMITEEEALQMVLEMDASRYGVVDYSQFKAFCNKIDGLSKLIESESDPPKSVTS